MMIYNEKKYAGENKSGTYRIFTVGAEDMLDTEVPFESGAEMTTVDISDPVWAKPPFENLTVS